MLKGFSIVTLGNIVGQVLRFTRNVIVARILTPEDFGVAATFWITTGFLMSLSELGIEKILVQDKQGDEDEFGGVAQLVILLRGLLIATVIFVLATPIARLFEIPEAVWGFRILAVIPLINAFMHRDIIRMQRHLSFKPYVLSKIVPDSVITLCAVPIAMVTRDYTAFLYISILYGLVSVISSHILAERKFILCWNALIFRRILTFGLPLLFNSLLIFAMMQGDRIVLAKSYTMVELGVYSVAFSLAMVIPSLLGSAIVQVFLPYLSRFQDDRDRLYNELVSISVGVALLATLIATMTVIAGPLLVTLIYSSKYGLAGNVIGILGIMHSIRLFRQTPSLASLSLADTVSPLVSNIFRQTGILFACFAALRGMEMEVIALSGVVGEIFATVAIIVSLKQRRDIPAKIWLKPLYLFLFLISTTWLLNKVFGFADGMKSAFVGGAVVTTSVLFIFTSMYRKQAICCLSFMNQKINFTR